jgi:NAD/NADP transhydrogenase beta subunit
MKNKILNSLLIITSLLGYLEWSGNSRSFLFEAEIDLIIKFLKHPMSAIHPFTLLPLVGQLLLLITLFQKSPRKILTYVAIACLGLLLGFMFIVGLISGNYKIVLSTIPFVTTAIITINYHRKR